VPDRTFVMLEETLAELAPEMSDDQRSGVAAEIARAEREAGLPALLLVSLIQQESRFDPRAVGPRGSLGLMQLRKFVAAAVARRHGLPFEGRETLLDPVRNVELGCTYLAELRDKFGTVALALAAYNKGPTGVRRDLMRGREAGRVFVAGVLDRYEAYDKRFGLPSAPASLASEAAQ
jgi:soluble lytic murein transglycosylase-like protein